MPRQSPDGSPDDAIDTFLARASGGVSQNDAWSLCHPTAPPYLPKVGPLLLVYSDRELRRVSDCRRYSTARRRSLFGHKSGPARPDRVDLAPDIARELIAVMIETGQPLPPGLHRVSVPVRISLVVPA